MDLKAHYHAKSCRTEKTWCDPHLNSTTGVAPSKDDQDNEEEQWWRVVLPDKDPYKVLRLELKKRGDGNHTDHVINKVTVEYKKENGDWEWYNDGAALPTGQKEDDDAEKIRAIKFEPPFVATEVKIHIKPADTNMKRIEGRYDLIVAKEPTKEPEEDEEKKPASKKEEPADNKDDDDKKDDASPHIKADRKMVKEEEAALDDAKAQVASIKEQVKEEEDQEKQAEEDAKKEEEELEKDKDAPVDAEKLAKKNEEVFVAQAVV